MKIAIMQPYFAPYIGYFQLMKSVDKFVVYDNIQFTKKGWINRNRILQTGKEELFSIPISKDSDYLDIRERKLSADFLETNKKTLRKIESSYKKAPYFKEVFYELNKCFLFDRHSNLFEFVFNSINVFKEYLKIDTPIIKSSEIDDENYHLKGKERVMHICKILEADCYINAIGGMELYTKEAFQQHNISLNFIKSNPIIYTQFENDFVPWLSIIDVLMFNSPEEINQMLDKFILL